MIIFKQQLNVSDRQTVAMKKGAKILCVQTQRNEICIWFACDEKVAQEGRVIGMVGTGHEISEPMGEYIGTVQLNAGILVFHLFDLGPA